MYVAEIEEGYVIELLQAKNSLPPCLLLNVKPTVDMSCQLHMVSTRTSMGTGSTIILAASSTISRTCRVPQK